MVAPTLNPQEHALAAATLSALGLAVNYEVMGSATPTSKASTRHLALYAPAGAHTCRTVQVHMSAAAAAAALAEPYQRHRVPSTLWSNTVGYVIGVPSRELRGVYLDGGGEVHHPKVSGLSWAPDIQAPALSDPAFQLDRDTTPALAAGHGPALDEQELEAIREVLDAFGIEETLIHAGQRPTADESAPPPIGTKALAVMGAPGSVTRVELHDDLGAAMSVITAPHRYGMVPQSIGRSVLSGYLVTIPGMRVYPLGGPDADLGPMELEDLT